MIKTILAALIMLAFLMGAFNPLSHAWRFEDYTCDQVKTGMFDEVVLERLGEPNRKYSATFKNPGMIWKNGGLVSVKSRNRKIPYTVWQYKHDDENLLVECHLYILSGHVQKMRASTLDRETGNRSFTGSTP
jgi:hypothetical protein